MIACLTPFAAILGLVSAPALGQGPQCAGFTADPTECGAVDAARAQMSTAQALIKEEFSRSNSYPPEAVRCYLTSANYYLRCTNQKAMEEGTKLRCNAITFGVSRPIGSGWTEAQNFSPTGAAGACAFSEASARASPQIQAPGGQNVLNALASTPGELRYSLYRDVECALAKPTTMRTSRKISFGGDGLQVLDWTTEGDYKVSAHWAKNIDLVPRAKKVEFTVTDESTVRLSWNNGAHVDIGADGLITGSNFLSQETYKPGACATVAHTSGRHFYPNVQLKPGVKFAREGAIVKK